MSPINEWMKFNLETIDSSFAIISSVVFIGGAARGLLFPLLWSLCQELGGNSSDLGYLSAVFGFGRLLSTSPMGYMSDKFQQKLPLVLSHSLLLFAALLWANAYTMKNLSLLYVSQFLLGFGSGTVGVTRSYIVEQTEPSQRTEMLAFLSALQYAGLTISSLFGSVLGKVGSASMHSKYWSFALPAYTLFLLILYVLVALVNVFKNPDRIPTLTASNTTSTTNARTTSDADAAVDTEIANKTTAISTTNSILTVVYFLIFINIVANGVMSVYETLIAKIGTQSYRMSNLSVGTLISVSGAVGCVQMLFFKQIWLRAFSDLQLMCIGIALMILSQIVIISLVEEASKGDFITSTVIIYALGYPIAKTAVLGAFSKIQKTGVQGAILSWFATAASFSRIVFPLMCSVLKNNGPFGVNMFVLVVAYCGLILVHTSISHYVDTPKKETYTPRDHAHIEMGIVSINSTTYSTTYSPLSTDTDRDSPSHSTDDSDPGSPVHKTFEEHCKQFYLTYLRFYVDKYFDKFQLCVLFLCFVHAVVTLCLASNSNEANEDAFSDFFGLPD